MILTKSRRETLLIVIAMPLPPRDEWPCGCGGTCRSGTALPPIALIDVLIGWLRRFRQQRRGRHDLTGLAVAALRHVSIDPRLLQRMVPCGDSPSIVVILRAFTSDSAVLHERIASPSEEDGARAAQSHAAAELRSRELQVVAEDPQQRHVWRSGDGAHFSVDRDFQLGHSTSRSDR